MSDQLLGYCGLYCGGCGVFQGTATKNPIKDESGNPLLCDGCNSGRTTPWCTDCAIKICAREKAVRTCIDCPSNPCEKIQGFMQDPKYPYHLEVQDNMRDLKAHGLSAWTKVMEERYTCVSCGSNYNWFEKTCKNCGSAIESFQRHR